MCATAAACDGTVTSDCDVAIVSEPPNAPTVNEPAVGSADVISGELVIASSPFQDPDVDDVHGESAFEIWNFIDGSPSVRVWSAQVTDPATLTRVMLSDGVFDAGAAVTELTQWENYGARVRYRDSSGACQSWSEWSEYRRFKTDDGSSYLFDPDVVHDVHVDIPPQSWNSIDAEATPPDCVPYLRSYYTGTVTFEDQVFEGAGVRSKGGCGSARHLDGKTAFKLNLSWDDPSVAGCPDERRLFGLKRLTLNNLIQDHSFQHERLGYALYHAMGVPTPRAAHMRVFVNGELWGLYVHVESIDRRFLARWFDDNDGMLYEGTYWCDLIPGNVPPTLDDTWCLSRKFSDSECDSPPAGADPRDYTLLRTLVDRIQAMPNGSFYPEVEQFFEFQTLLNSWAVDSVIAHWDAYAFDIMNNYRVYHNPTTDRWTLIPTGIDQTFRDDLDPFGVSGILARKCLDEPDCTAAFAQALSLAADKLEQLELDVMSQQIQTQIDSYVAEDPRKEGSYDEFVNLGGEVRDWIRQRPERVRDILSSRGF